jgi:hypothetical protein
MLTTHPHLVPRSSTVPKRHHGVEWNIFSFLIIYFKIRRAGVAQSVQCLITDWAIWVRSPVETKDFSSNLCVQTGSEAHPASCTMGTVCRFSGGKARPGRDADHSPPSNAEVVNE